MSDAIQSAVGRVTGQFCDNRTWRLTATAIWIGLLLIPTALLSASLSKLGDTRFMLPLMLQQLLIVWLLVPTMVMIVSAGGLDLSVGPVMSLTGIIMASLMSSQWHTSAPAAMSLALAAALSIGLLNGVLTGLARMPGVLITLIVMTLVRSIGLEIPPDPPRGFNLNSPDFLSTAGWIVLAAVVIGGIFLVNLTPFARRPAPNSSAAESWMRRAIYVGLPYVLSSLIAGFAGIVAAHQVGRALPGIGIQQGSDVIFAVVIGGTLLGGRFGTVLGGLVGAVFLQVFRTWLYSKHLSPTMADLVIMSVVLKICVLCWAYYALVGLLYRIRRRRAAAAPLGVPA